VVALQRRPSTLAFRLAVVVRVLEGIDMYTYDWLGEIDTDFAGFRAGTEMVERNLYSGVRVVIPRLIFDISRTQRHLFFEAVDATTVDHSQ
jgi:hypothetical protein